MTWLKTLKKRNLLKNRNKALQEEKDYWRNEAMHWFDKYKELQRRKNVTGA